MEKQIQKKKSLQGLLPGRETPHFFFLTAHKHDESWRCVHVDVREVRDKCGFAYAGQGQIMNLSQISGHELPVSNKEGKFFAFQAMSLTFSWTFLRHCRCLDATFGQLFTMRPPNFLFEPPSLCS